MCGGGRGGGEGCCVCGGGCKGLMDGLDGADRMLIVFVCVLTVLFFCSTFQAGVFRPI